MWNTPVGRFRIIAFIEGISYLVLLLIAMPIKYTDALGRNPAPVFYVGSIHGGLFVLYAIAGFHALFARGWGVKEAVLGFVAAIVPAGTFVYDRHLKREHEKELADRAGTAGDLQPPG